jgi:hypothetical protein
VRWKGKGAAFRRRRPETACKERCWQELFLQERESTHGPGIQALYTMYSGPAVFTLVSGKPQTVGRDRILLNTVQNSFYFTLQRVLGKQPWGLAHVSTW